MKTDNAKCFEICHELLCGEHSAVETYDLAIHKFKSQPCAGELQAIRDEHAVAVSQLEKNIRAMDGETSDDSGLWGATAKVIQQSANFFGQESALEALQKGESHGVDEYEDALKNPDVNAECQELIRSELLPRTRRHITTLDRMEQSMA